MLKPLVEPSLNKGVEPGSTAFERNLLPGFARWFMERLEKRRPDYLIPAETKGARLLEAVSDYARRELGASIQVPILLCTALSYMDRDALRGAQVMILDDARRTGASLDRHREGVERAGVESIEEAVCIARSGPGFPDKPEGCYRLVSDSELYREYVWQLTELVCGRGLPPEVDHHVFEMKLPGELPMIWGEVEAALGQFSVLSVDAPEREWGEVRGLTLHFPQLPGSSAYPTEGPNKIRLFPDLSTGTVYVVPVSFPAVELPREAAGGLSLEETLEHVCLWTRQRTGIGDFLARAAHTRSPEAIFRMLSATAETELVCGMAAVLGQLFGPEKVQITPQRDLFRRLYGPTIGAQVADRVAQEVEKAKEEDERKADLIAQEPAVPLFLSKDVMVRTRTVAEGLQELYKEQSAQPGFSPSDRVGQSLPEITETVDGDRLMASRCIDFGLAMTTLVPYVGEQKIGDRIRVERKYRVSEANRGFPFEDMEVVYQQIGEEILAFYSDYLAKHSDRFRDSHLPLDIATSLIAIMRSLLEKLKIPLWVEPGQPNPVIALRRKPEIVGPGQEESEFFVISREGGIVPSTYFEERCAANRLRIDTWEITESLENFLDLMLPLLDEVPVEKLDEVLRGWAMSSDRMLGMIHLKSAIEAALHVVDNPLKRILRGEADQQTTLGLVEQASVIRDGGLTDVETLAGNWAISAQACWPNQSKRVTGLLQSGAAPTDTGSLFDLPRALLDAAVTTTVLTTRLDEISARISNGREKSEDRERVLEVSRSCAELRQSLFSLESQAPSFRSSGETRELLVSAAEGLRTLAATLVAFANALAGDFRGPKGIQRAEEGDNARERFVLFMDLANSFVHALQHSPEENHEWKLKALGCAAQWGKALGGVQPRDQEGDAMWLEFEDAESAILCGAAIQMHAQSLRSTGIPQLQWSFRMAVDFGWIRDGDSGNATGLALDRPATLAKKVKDAGSTRWVLLTPEAITRCTGSLVKKPLVAALGREVELADVDHDGASMEPSVVDTSASVAQLASHIQAAAARISKAFGVGEPEETFRAADLPEERKEAGLDFGTT
jgi:hypothetical protein